MATHCSMCERYLESTVKNPTVALSTGTFHYDCYTQIGKAREAKAEAEAEARMEAEAMKLAKKLESRAARSARMSARWALKKNTEG